MTGEEYRRQLKEQIKQETKDDLRKRKEFLQAVDAAKQSQHLRQAVEGAMPPEDDSAEWMAKLNQQTAVSEAKTEMALDAALQQEQDRKAALELAAAEVEMRKIAAQNLVAQMKKEMFGTAETEETVSAPQAPTETAAPEKPVEEIPPIVPATAPVKGKTFGDF